MNISLGKNSPWALSQRSASVRTPVLRAPAHTSESLFSFAKIEVCTANQLCSAFESGELWYPHFNFSKDWHLICYSSFALYLTCGLAKYGRQQCIPGSGNYVGLQLRVDRLLRNISVKIKFSFFNLHHSRAGRTMNSRTSPSRDR